MNKIILEIPNKKDMELLIAFAKRLNSIVIDKKSQQALKKKSPVYWLEQLANRGGIKSIKEPVEWQREVRKDRKLYLRD
mgnify:CR=1 FL=1